MESLWENWTLSYFSDIHLKWRTTFQIVPSVDLPRLFQTRVRTALKRSRNVFELLLDFSLYITAVVSTAAFSSLDRMRISLNALTARNHDSRPMESHTSISIISLSYLGYKLCQQAPYMQRRCAIEQIMYIRLAISRMFSMAPIINLYLTPLFLVVRRTIPFSTFPMNVTLPLAFRWMVLHHSRGTIRLHIFVCT